MSVSITAWCNYKAHECERMAIAATESHQRLEYEQEQQFWVEYAERLASSEIAPDPGRLFSQPAKFAHAAGSIVCGVVIGLGAYALLVSMVTFPP